MNPALARAAEGAERLECVSIEVLAIVLELKHVACDPCSGDCCPGVISILDELRQDEARSFDFRKQDVPGSRTLRVRLKALPSRPCILGDGLEERWRLTHRLASLRRFRSS